MTNPDAVDAKGNRISLAYLRECFDYDPLTGALTWRHRPRHHFPDDRVMNLKNTQRAGRPAGKVTERGYIVVTLKRSELKAHRIAFALHYGIELVDLPTFLDHIDTDRANNRIANLRPATREQNQHNARRRVDNTSGVKGVQRRGRRWVASITAFGRRQPLGSFATLEDAVQARERAAQELHQDFARQA